MQMIDAALVLFQHRYTSSLPPYLDWLRWHSLIEEQPHHVDDFFQVSYFPVLVLQGLQVWQGKGSTSSEDGQCSDHQPLTSTRADQQCPHHLTHQGADCVTQACIRSLR